MCKRWFMFCQHFNKHLDVQYRKCEKCKQYLKDNNLLWDHMELEHQMFTNMQVGTEPQVTTDPATLDTSHQGHQVKCKYCDGYFKSVATCNMHINRRHKNIACPNVKSVL